MKTEKELDEMRFKVEVDKDNLDLEWAEQSKVFFEYSIALAEAIFDRDMAKAKLKQLEADLAGAIEEDPASYGLNRTTDTAIKNCIFRQPEWIEHTENVVKADLLVNQLDAMQRSMYQKRDSIEWLTKLYLSNYYAESELTDRVKERYKEKSTDEKMRRALQNKIKDRRRDD